MSCILAHSIPPSATSRQQLLSPEQKLPRRLQSTVMSPADRPSPVLRWLTIPARVLLISFLLALLAFAVCLFLGIIGLVIAAGLRGVHPNMTVAYRDFAFPIAVFAGAAALVAAVVLEFRHHRQQEIEERFSR
jgi:hypothetical protein